MRYVDHLGSIHRQSNTNGIPVGRRVALVNGFLNNLGDADQPGAQFFSLGLDFSRHRGRIINPNSGATDRTVLATQLPDVGQHMFDHAPNIDLAKKFVKRVPGQVLTRGIVKNMPGLHFFFDSQTVDIITGLRRLLIAKGICWWRRIIEFHRGISSSTQNISFCASLAR